MKIHLAADASALQQLDLPASTAIVIDAVRASSTIAWALANGGSRIIPVRTIQEAVAWKERHSGENPLLCGERQGLKIPGFDLGNSPREYVPTVVTGRCLVLTTTNGTHAVTAARQARRAVVGAFVNLHAVVAHLREYGDNLDVVMVPAGREGQPVLDDVVCAGMFVDSFLENAQASATNEAHLARMAYLGYRGRILQALRDSPSGKALIAAGLGDDLPVCADVGSLGVVPVVTDNGIVANPGRDPCEACGGQDAHA